MQHIVRRAAPSLLRQATASSSSAAGALGARQFAGAAPQRPSEEEDDTFELLPPGCSLKDPTYGRSFGGNRNSLSDPVLIYDEKPVEEYRPIKKRQQVPQAPLNVAAAQAKLQETKDAKRKAKEESTAAPAAAAAKEGEEDDLYVYLPPGSSMRDPVGLPNSMSDPLDRRVHYVDPNPAQRK